MLKLIPRSGSFLAGIKNPDCVASHVARATQIAFVLAEQEGGNAEHAAFLASIHDNAECRISDINRVTRRYIVGKNQIERIAFIEQCSGLPESIRTKYTAAFEEFEALETIESLCAHDADYLEMAFQAKYHIDQGISIMQDWMDNVEKALHTNSAKKIFTDITMEHSCHWWTGLKKSS